MRILQYSASTGDGGDAFHVVALSRALRALGHDARLLVTGRDSSPLLLERARADAVPCEALPAVSYRSSGFSVARGARLWRAFWRARPDVLHLHTPAVRAASDDLLAARLLPGCVRVLTLHGATGWGSGPAARQPRWVLGARFLLDGLIVPSEQARMFQLEAGVDPRRIAVAPAAVDLQRIASGVRGPVRAELGLSDQSLLVLVLGRLQAVKRPADSLAAFALVSARFPSARLVFAGAGEESTALRQLAGSLRISERVHFLGFRTDVPDLLAAADLLFLPTAAESFGVALVEAMQAGLPVVTSDAAPMRGEVVPDSAGLFAAVGDVEGHASNLARLLGDPALRRALGESGRSAVAERFSLSAVAQRHLAIYQQLQR